MKYLVKDSLKEAEAASKKLLRLLPDFPSSWAGALYSSPRELQNGKFALSVHLEGPFSLEGLVKEKDLKELSAEKDFKHEDPDG